jgi:hypothetical protein
MGVGGATMGQMALVALCLQNGGTPLVMRWAMTGQEAGSHIDTTHSVLVRPPPTPAHTHCSP